MTALPDPHCRIRSIRRKASPHLVEVMPRLRSDYRKAMHRNVDLICDSFAGDMALWSITAIGFDGCFNSAGDVHKASPIGRTLLPAALAEIHRRYNCEDIAIDIFNGKL